MAESFCRAARCRAVMPRGPCAAASQAMPLLMPQVRSRSTCGKEAPLRLITAGHSIWQGTAMHLGLEIRLQQGNRAAQDISKFPVARHAGSLHASPACCRANIYTQQAHIVTCLE